MKGRDLALRKGYLEIERTSMTRYTTVYVHVHLYLAAGLLMRVQSSS